MEEDAPDVLVVGAGAAGLNAALVLARVRRRVLVAGWGEPRNAPAEQVHGFLSRDGMPPAELLAAGRAEVERYGGRVVTGEVRALRRGTGPTGGFEADLAGRTVRARRVIVATGMHDELPDLPGLREHWAREVLHCPYCHGWEVRDRPLGVLAPAGNEQRAVHQALLVRELTDDVVFFGEAPDDTARAALTARGVRIEARAAAGLVAEDGALRGVRLADGSVVPRAALFVPARPVPHDALLTALGCERDASGLVPVDPAGRTGVPGVWAAGNVVDPTAQVVVAAAAGDRAARAVNLDLIEEDLTENGRREQQR
ncbi:NAD(P)/FAD-dependent oxidoreductase [Streptomyces lydicus]|uniref:NAD(P)/FAD-dependent oxidoreductase n=1 Tax=Streptomyces lydicus TaxID=47763 RepID=UPI0037154598